MWKIINVCWKVTLQYFTYLNVMTFALSTGLTLTSFGYFWKMTSYYRKVAQILGRFLSYFEKCLRKICCGFFTASFWEYSSTFNFYSIGSHRFWRNPRGFDCILFEVSDRIQDFARFWRSRRKPVFEWLNGCIFMRDFSVAERHLMRFDAKWFLVTESSDKQH